MNALKTKAIIAVVCSLILAVAPPSWAGPFGIETKLTASDGVALDQFGESVAISGNIAVVGANHSHPINPIPGKAYIFDVTTGIESHILLPSDGAAEDYFGTSVAVDGETAIVGSPLHDDNGASSGAAYLFDVTTGVQTSELLAGDGAPTDQFGSVVAISGNLAIVGGRFHDALGADSGAAYLFDVTTGMQVAELVPDDGLPGDHFGKSVGISSDFAIVGANFGDGAATDSGVVYVFNVNPANPMFGLYDQVDKLFPPDGATGDEFGESLAISGNTAVIGAPLKDSGDGAAYVYDISTGMMTVPLTTQPGGQFGSGIAIDGNIAILGMRLASEAADVSGRADLFDVTTGELMLSRTHSDLPLASAVNDQFGSGVGISGGVAIVGAHFRDDLGDASGAAYLYSVCEPPFDGDGDLSGDVGPEDYTIWAINFARSNVTKNQGDYNCDGFVDAADYTIWANTFGPIPVLPSSQAVPEPSTFTLASFGLIGLLTYGRRRRYRA